MTSRRPYDGRQIRSNTERPPDSNPGWNRAAEPAVQGARDLPATADRRVRTMLTTDRAEPLLQTGGQIQGAGGHGLRSLTSS